MSEQETEQRKCIVVVKVRGSISAQREAKETLEMLKIPHTNHAVLIDNRPSYLGMLQRVQSYVTWGEATKETIELMVKQRGKVAGGKKLTDEFAVKAGFKSLDELVGAIADCKVDYWKLSCVQHVFRLHPPKKGYKGKVKKSFRSGGESGYRGEEINSLIKRMV